MALSSEEANSLRSFVERCRGNPYHLSYGECLKFVRLAEKCADGPRSRGEIDFGAEALLGVAGLAFAQAERDLVSGT